MSDRTPPLSSSVEHHPAQRRRSSLARWGRATLTWGAPALLSGCLVDEPSGFEEPARTAPILFLDQTVPSNTAFLSVVRDTTIPFSVLLQSEDLGQDLVASPWINFGLRGEQGLPLRRIPAGTFDEPRTASFPVTLDSRVPLGCVPLTILFFHVEGLDPFNDNKPLPGTLVSRATWWLLVDQDPTDVSIADCPEPSTATPATR